MKHKRIKEGFKDQKIVICPNNFLNFLEENKFIKNFYVTDIGYFPNARYHFIERTEGCSENILIFCLKGEGCIKISENTYILKKDTVIIIPKNSPHIYNSNNDDPWTIGWFHFSGDYAEEYIGSLNDNHMFEIEMEKSIKFESLFNEVLNLLEKGINKKSFLYSCQCLNYLLSMLFFTNNNFKETIKSGRQYLDKIIEFMIKNLDKKLTLDEVAKAVYLSKSHVSLIFKQESQCSPLEFFTKLKIQHSCSLIKYSKLSIKEIALKFGYDDPYYFSRVFKKIMTISPAEYRRNKARG